MPPTYTDITGKRFGRLVALTFLGRINGSHHNWWLCECDCGNKPKVRTTNLESTRSCGCLQKDVSREQAKKNLSIGRQSLYTPAESALNSVYGMYRRNAANDRRTFKITKDEFKTITALPCYYCGVEPETKYVTPKKFIFIGHGLDRKDNRKGYLISNVVSCCTTCNRAKRTMTTKDFLAWITRIYQYQVQCPA